MSVSRLEHLTPKISMSTALSDIVFSEQITMKNCSLNFDIDFSEVETNPTAEIYI